MHDEVEAVVSKRVEVCHVAEERRDRQPVFLGDKGVSLELPW